MLSEKIYELIIEKANLNTQGVTVAGNYLFQYYDGKFNVTQQSTNNKYDLTELEVVPVSEVTNEEIAFVESNNRSEFLLTYQFSFPSYRTEVLEALQELRNYFYNNQSFQITDTDGVTYNGTIKVTRPKKIGEYPDVHSGDFIMLYDFKVTATTYDSTKGYDSNNAVLKVDAYNMPYTSFTKGSNIALDPSNKVTSLENTSYEPFAQGVGGEAIFIYDRSDVAKKILKACDGNETTQSRDTTFTIFTNIDGIATTVVAYMWGSYSLAPNGIILMNVKWSEA